MNADEIIDYAHQAYCEPAEEDRERVLAVILATLDAIREPSDAMMMAAIETPGLKAVNICIQISTVHGCGLGDYPEGESPLQQSWRAMIDALKRDVAGLTADRLKAAPEPLRIDSTQ